MAADGIIPTSATPGKVFGDSFMDAVQEELTALYKHAHLRLSNVAGDGNTITADLAPDLDPPLVDGRKFSFLPNADNAAGAVAIAINGGTPVAVVNSDGGALNAGQIVAARLAVVEFDGTSLRLEGSTGLQKVFTREVFTTSGTFTKPAGADPNGLVFMQLWAAGGPGTPLPGTVGGPGGSYAQYWYRLGDLPATLDIIVPAAPAVGAVPGHAVVEYGGTTYGIAYAGSSAFVKAGSIDNPGAGGSPHGRGENATSSLPGQPASREGGAGSDNTGEDGINYGGGGGGGIGRGGHATWGGGGGGGEDMSGTLEGTGGLSKYGGNGGDNGVAGQPRGGGGGGEAPGGRGEIIFHVIG